MNSPYVSTFLGNRFFLTSPQIDDVAIEDIAHEQAADARVLDRGVDRDGTDAGDR